MRNGARISLYLRVSAAVLLAGMVAGLVAEAPATATATATATTTPTTSVLIPATGATLSGSTYLDASASNATSVEFLLFGGKYGYAAPVVCTATPTLYGWLCGWNTTTVPNGSYALVSEATNAAGSAFGVVTITVNNPSVSFGGPVVFTYPSESVGLGLSQPSTDTVQVDFTTEDGPEATLQWGEWVGSASSFSPSSGTVTFAPGQTTTALPLSVSPTNLSGCSAYFVVKGECYPSVTITLTHSTNAVLGSTTATNVYYYP